MLVGVSVVVPIGRGDEAWRGLLPSFSRMARESEVWLVATESPPLDLGELIEKSQLRCSVTWIASAPGRARQMNQGAECARGDFLWFLHADSRLGVGGFVALQKSLAAEPRALHFFDLEFGGDGPRLARWNAWGANLRSRWLGLPFGDQGFCVCRTLFNELSGYDEQAPYGEDHLFVWAARRAGVPIRRVGATLRTSARKYAAGGWFVTTSKHLGRTWWQAWPQLLKCWFRGD